MLKMLKNGQILDFRASFFPHKRPKNKNETKLQGRTAKNIPEAARKPYRVRSLPWLARQTVLKMLKMGKFGQIVDSRASLFPQKIPRYKNETKLLGKPA